MVRYNPRMTPKNHSDCVNAVLLLMSELGALPLKYTTGQFRAMDSDRVVKVGITGASDTIHCYRGRAVFIEVKFGDDPWREEQQKFAKAVETAGGLYILARFPGGEETIRCLLS